MKQIFGYTPLIIENGEQYVRYIAIHKISDGYSVSVRNGDGQVNTINVPADQMQKSAQMILESNGDNDASSC